MIVPTKAFLTKGVGFHKNELQSYELALRDARIEKQNIVSVSSIFPPNCEILDLEDDLKLLRPGQITFCVMARLSANEYGRMIGASVGIAFPSDRNQNGYISEFHAYGQEQIEIGDFAERLDIHHACYDLGGRIRGCSLPDKITTCPMYGSNAVSSR